MPVRFYEQNVVSGLRDKRKLAGFITNLVLSYRKSAKRADLTYIFCDDEYLLSINQQFLQHDTLTDIITFDLTESDSEVNAEIYISTDRVRENAIRYEAPYPHELHRVIFHGALHLCGYKDKKKADQQLMREMESRCLEKYKKEIKG